MELRQRGFVVMVGLVCLFLLFLVSYSDNSLSSLGFSWFRADPLPMPSRGYLVDTPGCQMPNWDAFDPSVLRLYKKNILPYLCSRKLSFLVIEPNATIQIDVAILHRIYQISSGDISCYYKPILRDPGKVDSRTDSHFVIGTAVNLTFGEPLGQDFVHVYCVHFGKVFHDEFLALTPLKEEIEKLRDKSEKNAKTAKEKLNIIIVGIDSISKLNFIRHFPKTKRLLEEEFKAIELQGYNKVADNTFPNLVPLLTGQFISYYWNETVKNKFFDDIDLVWKHYADRGYRTLMAEDAPKIATFNYLRKGFKDPPADYYFRPFAIAVEASGLRKRSKDDCFDDRMEIKVIFDYVKSFIQTMEDRPFFSFSFAARLTHDVLNKAAMADFPAYKFLKFLRTSNVTKNSLVIFMSDHGIRFGPIRETYIGKFEERWPIMFLAFPDWFYERYPQITKNLKTNQKRLTTPFDIHATLQDLLDFQGEPKGNVSLSSRGISLFEEIPEERTCADAAIKPHWCTCQQLTPVMVNSSEVRVAAKVIVDTLNEWLANYTSQCAKLLLDKVIDAHMGQPGDEVLRFHRHVHDVVDSHVEYGPRVNAPVDYLITVRTEPSGAIFEGTVRVDNIRDQRIVLGDVSRINVYGHFGDCLDDAALRKYCYCKAQLLVS